MAIAHVQSKGAVGSSATPAVTLDTGPTQGNLLVASVFSSSTTAIGASASGFTVLTSTSGGSGGSTRAARMLYKVAGAGEASTITLSAGNAPWSMNVVEYSGTAASPLNIDNAQINASSTSQPTPSVTISGTPTEAVAVCMGGVRSGSVTFSSETIGGVAANERVDSPGSGVASSALYDRIITSPSGSIGGASTASGAQVGAGTIAVFNAGAVAAAVIPDLVLQPLRQT